MGQRPAQRCTRRPPGEKTRRAGVRVRPVQCANCVMGHRRQFLAELVVATIVADGAEGNTCCSVSHCAVRLSDPSQLAQDPA